MITVELTRQEGEALIEVLDAAKPEWPLQNTADELRDRLGIRDEPEDVRVARLRRNFVATFTDLAREAHANAKAKGFWEKDRNDGEMIALMHSELSEALEAIRHKNPPDDHIPKYSGAEAELADVIIRIMDMAAARGFDVASAVLAKMDYNKTRQYMHGKTC